MSFDPLYAIPLYSALVYALASLLYKQAIEEGGALRIQVVMHWVWILAFTPLLFLHKGPVNWQVVPAAIIVGVFFFIGATCTSFAIRLGALSVVTPVMGAKVVFVAIIASIILGDSIPASWWLGAILCTIAVFTLNPPRKKALFGDWRPVCLALGASASYACADVTTQGWINKLGLPLFVYIAALVCTLLCTCLIPFFKAPLSELSRKCVIKTSVAAVLISSQFLCLIYFFAISGSATLGNILYSTRALWAVILVWIIGRWFGNHESAAGKKALLLRLTGSSLLIVAIVIILI